MSKTAGIAYPFSSSSSTSSLLAAAEIEKKREGNNMNTSPRLKIQRESSIEDEPRTLTFDQLQYAREAALYVLSTKTIEEAIEIFTEGLKPVLSIRDNMDLDDDAEMLGCDEMEHKSPLFLEREGASAPF